MNILICTGVYPPEVGGPAMYAKNLADEFLKSGHNVKVIFYKSEKKLPAGLRHLAYFFRIFIPVLKSDAVFALDTFSVGLPAVLAGKILGKKIVLRVAGDFLWENYVESSGKLVTLEDFYKNMPALSLKHKIIFKLSKFILRNSFANVFNTAWQKNIFEKYYKLDRNKNFVAENFYPEKQKGNEPVRKNFIFAGRDIKLKNIRILNSAFDLAKAENPEIELEILSGLAYDNLMEKIRNCYALILPSITDISPNFILEAISFNKPFIMTRETGLREKLEGIGIFIDPFSQEDIKNKILFLADDKKYDDAREKITNFNFTHSWKQIASEFLDIAQC